jgi:hydrogenase expression/formation protein HypD
MVYEFEAPFRDPDMAKSLVQQIRSREGLQLRVMEVCGTHTMSIFEHGIRSLLPESLTLLSGPGCPVCVTDQREIDGFIHLADRNDTILTIFGDLMRVPGSVSTLQKKKARGKDIRIVYSTFDALKIARENPDRQVVFTGVGFETTAPTIAAAITVAAKEKMNNFSVFSAHKLVPPALFALMGIEGNRIDAFLLPGHVSVVIGLAAYRPFFEKYRIPCIVTGFEPNDILRALAMVTDQLANNRPLLENAYPRAVSEEGNVKARQVMDQVFEVADADWRGLGTIPESGLAIRKEYETFDAQKRFDVQMEKTGEPTGCRCHEILTGLKTPPECPLYKKKCSPVNPVGPCMVSSEGACAAYYKYHGQ